MATVPAMDTMKLLLGATVALLLGALVMSWQGMNRGVESAPADEVARLRKQINELRAEQDRIQLEKQIQQLKANTPEIPTPGTNAAEIEAVKAQLAAQQAALAQMETEKQRAERDAKLSQEEEGLLSQRDLEKGDSELRRARMIADALLIGRVQEYVEDAEYGGFITFQILMPEQVQPGTVLAIRRKTGILGQLSVTEVSAEGGIANPLPGFGPAQPEVGDELILPPPY
jgi:multidrug efflux pump subunit AcrA (membrane-fusion protein)